MKILIAGDTAPIGSDVELFNQGNVKDIIGDELSVMFRNADFSILNLEAPLTDEVSPIQKCGPCLRAPKSTVNGFRAINPTFCSLANNHIMDHGEIGLTSTIKQLSNHSIAYAGAGINLNEAQKPYINIQENIKIGIYCCAENEFSIADKSRPGANPFDPLDSPDHISELKDECDYVIVLYHGGAERYRYPSPYLRKVCRKMVDKGANLVVCQHSHCIGCEERYGNGVIVYGQGDFIFKYNDDESSKNGLLIDVSISSSDGDNAQIYYIPVIRGSDGIKLAKNEEKDKILEGFYKRTEEIKNEGFVEESYSRYARINSPLWVGLGIMSMPALAVREIFGRNVYYRLLKLLYTKKRLLRLLNRTTCEAHLELLRESINGIFQGK